jgi:hypothetical protein
MPSSYKLFYTKICINVLSRVRDSFTERSHTQKKERNSYRHVMRGRCGVFHRTIKGKDLREKDKQVSMKRYRAEVKGARKEKHGEK